MCKLQQNFVELFLPLIIFPAGLPLHDRKVGCSGGYEWVRVARVQKGVFSGLRTNHKCFDFDRYIHWIVNYSWCAYHIDLNSDNFFSVSDSNRGMGSRCFFSPLLLRTPPNSAAHAPGEPGDLRGSSIKDVQIFFWNFLPLFWDSSEGQNELYSEVW